MSWEGDGPLESALVFAPFCFALPDGFFISKLSENLRIQLPNRIVECRCEGDPQQIRNEQRARERSDAPESDQGGGDQCPQQEDVSEGQVTAMPGEEQPTPQRIECELYEKQGELRSGCPKAADTPDQPGRNPHEGIKNGPYRP